MCIRDSPLAARHVGVLGEPKLEFVPFARQGDRPLGFDILRRFDALERGGQRCDLGLGKDCLLYTSRCV